MKSGCSDAFLLYVYGLCIKQEAPHRALRAFTSAVKEWSIFVCFTRRFPLFWGAWEELLSVTVTRSDLLFVLKHTDDSVIRDLFWIALMNRMNEVGTVFWTSSQIGVPPSVLDRLDRCASRWWFYSFQKALLQYHKGGERGWLK